MLIGMFWFFLLYMLMFVLSDMLLLIMFMYFSDFGLLLISVVFFIG